jgi:hypothetical protein
MQAFREGFRRYSSKTLIGLWILGGPVTFEPAEAATPDPEMAGYIAVEGGRAWYRINGIEHFADGKIPLLVIHGGPGVLAPLPADADRPRRRAAGDPLRPAGQR